MGDDSLLSVQEGTLIAEGAVSLSEVGALFGEVLSRIGRVGCLSLLLRVSLRGILRNDRSCCLRRFTWSVPMSVYAIISKPARSLTGEVGALGLCLVDGASVTFAFTVALFAFHFPFSLAFALTFRIDGWHCRLAVLGGVAVVVGTQLSGSIGRAPFPFDYGLDGIVQEEVGLVWAVRFLPTVVLQFRSDLRHVVHLHLEERFLGGFVARNIESH